MILGIEIGGTKLQLGVGDGQRAEFADFVRLDIDRTRAAAGIREQILTAARELAARNPIERVGYGFGGPVDHQTGCVRTSHQVEGWTNFPLAAWTEEELGVPAVLGNDCDVATLAEATLGAGAGHRTVFYLTVGTGIGGGLVVDGVLHGSDRPAVAEIGHMRPGLQCEDATQTVESIASGLGMETAARKRIAERCDGFEALASRCGPDLEGLSGQLLAAAAGEGNPLAAEVIATGVRTLGWAIAQAITLIAPDIIVVGGGVAMMPPALFLEPLRAAVASYSFAPLRDSSQIVEPALGEEVVVHGAIINASRNALE